MSTRWAQGMSQAWGEEQATNYPRDILGDHKYSSVFFNPLTPMSD